MGNACNCVSRENPTEEQNLTKKTSKSKEKPKKQEKDHDESNLDEDEGDEKLDLKDPDLEKAAIKIQVNQG